MREKYSTTHVKSDIGDAGYEGVGDVKGTSANVSNSAHANQMSTATNAVCLITVLTASLPVHFGKLWCSLRAFTLGFSIVFYNRIMATCCPSQERQLVLMESMNRRLDSFLASPKKLEEKNATLQQELRKRQVAN